MISRLSQGGFNTNGQSNGPQVVQTDYSMYGKFRPPIPRHDFQGDIKDGYSFKFDSDMAVVDKDGGSVLHSGER